MTTAGVAKAAFQGFVMEFHIAELFTILGILENKHNIPQLINCMQSFNLKYNDQKVEKKRGRRFLNLTLTAMAYNVVGMSIVVTLICFISPCFHPFLVTNVCGNSCDSDATTSEISFICRAFESIIQLLHFLPCTITGGPAMIISLLSLDYIRSNLLTLRYICASKNLFSCNSEEQRLRRKHMYREIQILAIVCNDCCQKYYWTSIQFHGLVAVIVPFYSIIVFGDQLPLYFALVVLVFICFIAMFCLFVFEIGSQSAKLSQEILNGFKRNSKPSDTGKVWGRARNEEKRKGGEEKSEGKWGKVKQEDMNGRYLLDGYAVKKRVEMFEKASKCHDVNVNASLACNPRYKTFN
ncbi:unnamed protein product [Orchesella dallaii]|uniref:Uncharacterized protein n=1 Tax=Orchesella dallaii TaxID=48710 RepID=A0ABP1RJZ2_9HEXA